MKVWDLGTGEALAAFMAEAALRPYAFAGTQNLTSRRLRRSRVCGLVDDQDVEVERSWSRARVGIRLSGSTSCLGCFVLLPEVGIDRFVLVDATLDVIFQSLQQPLEIGLESRWINHCGCFVFLIWSMLPPPR